MLSSPMWLVWPVSYEWIPTHAETSNGLACFAPVLCQDYCMSQTVAVPWAWGPEWRDMESRIGTWSRKEAHWKVHVMWMRYNYSLLLFFEIWAVVCYCSCSNNKGTEHNEKCVGAENYMCEEQLNNLLRSSQGICVGEMLKKQNKTQTLGHILGTLKNRVRTSTLFYRHWESIEDFVCRAKERWENFRNICPTSVLQWSGK